MAFLRAEIILSQRTSSLSSLDRSYTLVIRLGRGIEAMTEDWEIPGSSRLVANKGSGGVDGRF